MFDDAVYKLPHSIKILHGGQLHKNWTSKTTELSKLRDGCLHKNDNINTLQQNSYHSWWRLDKMFSWNEVTLEGSSTCKKYIGQVSIQYPSPIPANSLRSIHVIKVSHQLQNEQDLELILN